MNPQPSLPLPTLTNIAEALNSNNNDQVNIAQYGVEWLNLLLAKNRDYGSSAFKVPVLAPDLPPESAIRVRMSDKIERLQNLIKNPDSQSVDESIDDTLGDLASYGLLLLIVRKANREDSETI